MPAKNLYGVLGLSWGADEQEIKSAYRQLAKSLHPDHHPDDPDASDRFKEIVAAYWVLSDPARRVAYLRDHGFESILQNAACRQSAQLRSDIPREGQDIIVRLDLSLEEIASGVVKKVKVRRQCNCTACGGTGFEGGRPEGACAACHGSGSVPDLLRSRRGVKDATLRCRRCHGSGRVQMNSCSSCQGRRRIIHNHEVSIGISAGAEDRHRMVIKSLGHEGIAGGDPGDIKVVIQQKPHPYFERRGSDLVYTCPITVSQWMEGADLHLPSLNGDVRLKITPGLKPEGILKVPSRGLPGADGTSGDLLVQYRLFIPQKLSRRQLTILKRLEEMPGFSPALDARGFFPRES
jgi:molecular chaperone DnaJ